MLHMYPNTTADGSNGDVTGNTYHLYAEDAEVLKDMGVCT